MARIRKYRYFVGDFETTVYEGQERTDVWASALVELGTEDVSVDNTLANTWKRILKLKGNLVIYYHNLKFDGSFLLDFIVNNTSLKQAYVKTGSGELDIAFEKTWDMQNGTYLYMISDMGQWYHIVIKLQGRYIEFRDSLKLLPFSVKAIGKSFSTKHKKLSMEYEGFREPGGYISDEERMYIMNDVLVVKEAMEIMLRDGYNRLTIGACCIAEYKEIMGKEVYNSLFPDQTLVQLDREQYGASTADEYVRRSYRGGWCYLVKGAENRKYKDGVTVDVNSLYPSVMHSSSGNYYPVGNPVFWKGDFIPDEAEKGFYFVRVRTRFYIKPGMLPFIQIKGSMLYDGTECLESSDVYDRKTGQYSTTYIDREGREHGTRQNITMSMVEYSLFLAHYDVVDFEILDGCYYHKQIGIFDEYINKYMYIKMHSSGAKKIEAKLFLNNLYGKLASSDDSSFKFMYKKEDGVLGFVPVEAHDKKAGHIACGSAVTSCARFFTISAAQKNYHGADERGFKYADTDSMHCDLSPGEVEGITVDGVRMLCWKLETYWDEAVFVRQKTYMEHVTHNDGQPVEPYYNVKCAGMPDRCKELLVKSMCGYTPEEYAKMPESHKRFVEVRRTMEDFKKGLVVPGKLMPKRIPGGIILVDTNYEMKG